MKITEVTTTKSEALIESIDADNDTGFLTEDLVKIVETNESKRWSKPVTGDQLMNLVESWIN